MTMNEMTSEAATALRTPFPPGLVGHRPQGNTQLDFVGHAAVTDRLLQVDPEWSWEPMGVDEFGRPAYDRDDQGHPIGLWIRLTVCGVTRLGFGDAAGKSGGNAVKEMIGDALRNAAMRFGVALDLWSKQDLADTSERHAETRSSSVSAAPPIDVPAVIADLMAVVKELGVDEKAAAGRFAEWHAKHLTVAQAAQDDPDAVRGFTERLANGEITVGAPA